MGKKILFDHLHNYVQTDWFLKVARGLGFSTVLLTDKNSVKKFTHADFQIEVDPHNNNETIEKVVKFHDENPIDAIVSSDDAQNILRAKIAEKLNLDFISVETAEIISNKFRQKKFMAAHKIPCAQSLPASSFEELTTACEKIGFPVVIKPVSSWGSLGVVKIGEMTELNGYYNEINDKVLKTHGSRQDFLVEEYLSGAEVSVEGIVNQGDIHLIAITDKMVADEPFFVETGHTVPSRLPSDLLQEIRELTIKAIKPLQIKTAGIHVEIKLTASGLKINEIHARPGGGGIPSIVTMAYGLDFVAELIKSAAGEAPSFDAKWNKAAAIRFIVPASSGKLVEIKGEKEITRQKGVCFYQRLFNWAPGKIVEYPPKSSTSRIAMIQVMGKNPEEVYSRTESAVKSIEIITQNTDNNHRTEK